MYNCLKCNKEFKYESEYNRHLNRKILCYAPKKEYKCELCNVKFNRPSDQRKHEKTTKHKLNLQNENAETKNDNDYINNKNYNQLLLENTKLENKYNNAVNEINDLKNTNKELNKDIEILKIKLKTQDQELNILKMDNKIHNNLEYIYIIHPMQCINTNIYKIGRTRNVIKRHRQYPKGSELLLTIPCINSIELEKKILNYLKNNESYYQMKEYGVEYFKCDLNNLISDMYKLSDINS